MREKTKKVVAAGDAPEKTADELMKELDRDSKSRNMTGKFHIAMRVMFVAYAAVMLIMTLMVSGATPYTRLPLFMGLTLFIGYLKFPACKKDAMRDNYIPWYDIILALASLAVYGYYVVNQKEIIMMANRIGMLQIVLGIIGLLLLVELCRRAIGIPMLCVAGAFTVYAVFYLLNNNPRTALRQLIYNLFYNLNCGIFSTPVSVCASFIVLFIILGSFLEKTGIGTFFVDLANSIAGASPGGPAKVAVIASGLEGMYSGSSVANTVGSGSVTIPMMKRTGYRPEFAAAVEAAASTGGQIMPPIMGAAAFLMAEITGYSYFTIVIAAILPALLYFTGIFMMVHFEAKRCGLNGLPKETLPKFFKLLLRNGYLLLPIVVLMVCMNYYTPGMSASFAILFALIVSLIGKVKLGEKDTAKGILRNVILVALPLATLLILWQLHLTTMGPAVFAAILVAVGCSFFSKDAPLNIEVAIKGFEGGTHSSIGVAVACGMAGIISGVVTMTALGSTLINVIVPLAQKNILFALFLTMLACIVLGMGVPTTANYVIMATITAPILIEMGIPMLAAHMFVFYFGIVADITPPVALAAYAGAAIAKCNPMKAGLNATKLAITAFIIPYIFALNPKMLLVIGDPTVMDIVLIIISSFAGILGVSAGMEGYLLKKLAIWQRIVIVAAGLMLIYPGWVTDLIGILVIVALGLMQYIQKKSEEHHHAKA